MPEPSEQLLKAIAVTAQIYGRDLSKDAARVYAGDLADYPEHAVLGALKRCRKECRGFPSIADIVARIDDGRPGVEEAWAMIPKDESSSVVWTEEMREAYGACRGLLERDEIAARQTFREVYLRLIMEARTEGRSAHWEPSLGVDQHTHGPVLREAVRKGRITEGHAQALLPDLPMPRLFQISGPVDEPAQVNPSEMIARIRERIGKREEA